MRSIWLIDLDAKRGRRPLERSIRNLKNARMLRFLLVHHLVLRANWQTWSNSDRQILLGVAGSALEILGKKLTPDEAGDVA